MSEAATETKTKRHYDDIPGAQINSGAIVARQKWEEFQNEVKARTPDFAAMLPPNIRIERFIAAAIAAAKQNPDLLFADQRTVFASLVKAAQDGLLPDGREGVITIYNTNIAKKGESARWIKAAQWNPMIFGLRKRAMELGGIIIDAQVVYENDKFVRYQGDDPRIEHVPAPLGTPRGRMIGVYAIFKQGCTILHREVMGAEEVQATREQSRAKDSLMWTVFETEGWRKTVVRRGIKTVPVSEDLENIVRREDENFEFGQTDPPRAVLVPPPAPRHSQKAVDEPKSTGQSAMDQTAATPESPASEPPSADEPYIPPSLPGDWSDYIQRQYDEFLSVKSAADRQAVCDAFTDAVTNARERGELSGEQVEDISEAWNAAVSAVE